MTCVLTWPVSTALSVFTDALLRYVWLRERHVPLNRLNMFLNAEVLQHPAGQDVPNVAETS